jgi:hypothetical protein
VILNQARRGYNRNLAADTVTIRFSARGPNADPAVPVATLVPENIGFLAQVRHHDVDISIVIHVAESCAAACGRLRAAASTEENRPSRYG